MRHISAKALLFAAAVSTLFFTSCATPENRIASNPALFQGLSAGDRALVSEGKIRNGLSRDGVFLAWGNPDHRTTASVNGRPAETWVYTSTTVADRGLGYGGYGYGYGGYGFGPGFYGGRLGYIGGRHGRGHYRYYGGYYDPFFDPFYRIPERINYPERTVSFQNGRVVAFQFLAAPRVY